MPINDKQQAFINEYMINGHNASQAYKKAYPNTKAGWNKLSARLMAKEGIKKVIAGLMAVSGAIAERTVQSVDKMYQQAYDLASTGNQPAAMVSACTGIARLYGMDKDVQTTIDQPADLTPEQHQQALEASNRQLDVKLSPQATASPPLAKRQEQAVRQGTEAKQA